MLAFSVIYVKKGCMHLMLVLVKSSKRGTIVLHVGPEPHIADPWYRIMHCNIFDHDLCGINKSFYKKKQCIHNSIQNKFRKVNSYSS